MDTLTIINKLANFINTEQKEYDGNLIILPNSSESINSKCFYDDFLKNKNINIEIKKYSQINISFENLFKNKFYNFKKIDYEYKNKKNTFLKSLMTIIDPSFYYINERDFDNYIAKILAPIGYEIEENSLIKKFNLNYKINKTLIENLFITFNENLDNHDDLNIFIQFFSHYFNINLFIIENEKNNFNNFNINKFNSKDNNLFGIIEKNDNQYYPILYFKDNDIKRLLDYHQFNDIIDNINFNYDIIENNKNKKSSSIKKMKVTKINDSFNTNNLINNINNSVSSDIQKETFSKTQIENENECVLLEEEIKINSNEEIINKIKMKKYKLSELQELAEQYNIPIKKKSEKTVKMLNKTIKDLEDDLLKIL
jgi:hypothetical protein